MSDYQIGKCIRNWPMADITDKNTMIPIYVAVETSRHVDGLSDLHCAKDFTQFAGNTVLLFVTRP